MKKKKKQNLILPVISLFLIMAVLIILYQAVITGIVMIDNTESTPAEKNTNKVIRGQERTDVMISYQTEDSRTLMLLNLSHQEYGDICPEEYPADTLENDGMLPGEFVELIYTAEYTFDTEDHFQAEIKSIREGSHQIFPQEALSKRTYQTNTTNVRTANGEPIQIYQQEYADFVIVPAGNCYYLFTPDSDHCRIFDQYKKIIKEIEINGEKKQLQIWVLCNHNMTDGAVLDALYQGRVTDNPNLFFVGYDGEYPCQFSVEGYTQPFLYHMNQHYISAEVSENVVYHIQPDHVTSAALLPEDVQHDIAENWNKSDDILVFGGNYDASSTLTFDDNNRPAATSGDGQGYVIFYLQTGFFENICSGVMDE